MKNINSLFKNMKIAEIGFKSTLFLRQKGLFLVFQLTFSTTFSTENLINTLIIDSL